MRGSPGVDIGPVPTASCLHIWKFGPCEKLKKKSRRGKAGWLPHRGLESGAIGKSLDEE